MEVALERSKIHKIGTNQHIIGSRVAGVQIASGDRHVLWIRELVVRHIISLEPTEVEQSTAFP